MWSNNRLGRHFLTCVQNAWTYFNEAYQDYSLLCAHDSCDIFKVVCSKIKVTDDMLHFCIPSQAYDDKVDDGWVS